MACECQNLQYFCRICAKIEYHFGICDIAREAKDAAAQAGVESALVESHRDHLWFCREPDGGPKPFERVHLVCDQCVQEQDRRERERFQPAAPLQQQDEFSRDRLRFPENSQRHSLTDPEMDTEKKSVYDTNAWAKHVDNNTGTVSTIRSGADQYVGAGNIWNAEGSVGRPAMASQDILYPGTAFETSIPSGSRLGYGPPSTALEDLSKPSDEMPDRDEISNQTRASDRQEITRPNYDPNDPIPDNRSVLGTWGETTTTTSTQTGGQETTYSNYDPNDPIPDGRSMLATWNPPITMTSSQTGGQDRTPARPARILEPMPIGEPIPKEFSVFPDYYPPSDKGQ